MIFSKASLPVWFRNLLDHSPTWPESETHMILQLQAKVHGLGNLGVSTCKYPIFSWFETPKFSSLFSLKNEVEHDFFEGLSTSVISKFSRPPPNLTRIGNLYDFANAS